MFGRSQRQSQQFTQAKSSRHHGSTNEELIARLKDELAATKLHLQAETYGRIAANNELEIANSRIDQLHADNCELRSQLQILSPAHLKNLSMICFVNRRSPPNILTSTRNAFTAPDS